MVHTHPGSGPWELPHSHESHMESESHKGIVYLVGAGPGDPDLITVRAKYLLEHCDAVVYDSLIPDELVLTLPADLDRRFVGKKTDKHPLPQEDINDLLVRLASQGKRVVRLKGGDPFVFGRGAEEAAYLRQHGIRYEIVPGITSGVAAPAFAGIPCTDRTDASFVMFVTGHKASDKILSDVPWDWVGGARKGTLVIYMGVSEIENIVGKLLSAGMPPDTPAAAVERGTVSTQRIVTTTLSDLPGKVAELHVKPPTIFVIGTVVNHHETLRWFRDRPLFGVRVMVTRPADQAATMYRDLRELGAEVLAFPTIDTAEDFRPDEWDALRKIKTDKRWLMFTSENGVRYFLKQWFATVGDIRRLSDYRIAASGDGTIRALNAFDIAPDFVPTTGTTAALAQQMGERLDLAGGTLVRVRSSGGTDSAFEALGEKGAKVISLPVHRTFHIKWPVATKEKLSAYPPDVIIFTSGSAVDGLADNLDRNELEELGKGATIVSVGPATSRVIRSHGMDVTMESKEHTIPAIIEELLSRHRSNPLKRTA